MDPRRPQQERQEQHRCVKDDVDGQNAPPSPPLFLASCGPRNDYKLYKGFTRALSPNKERVVDDRFCDYDPRHKHTHTLRTYTRARPHITHTPSTDRPPSRYTHTHTHTHTPALPLSLTYPVLEEEEEDEAEGGAMQGPEYTEEDRRHMRRALELAAKALGA